jgi:phosphopentomutase
MKRVFLIVLDSFGIGAMPDSESFGDVGVNTLAACATSPELNIPNMVAAGLGCIDGVSCLPKGQHTGAIARLRERSMGKDTTIGHWEIAGLVSPDPLPTYPEGFPAEVLEPFKAATGRGILANAPWSGTAVLDAFGEEHLKTGDLIVYTSADSVFQIAAHEEVVPPETLYEYCRAARKILQGKHGVGRVIARPFLGDKPGSFKRTSNRHDFSLEPPKATMLDAIKAQGLDSIAVGKIYDIFAGIGTTEHVYNTSNTNGMEHALHYADQDFHGLCFVNLVDFDMQYGHRRDIPGYARALNEFDAWLPSLLEKLGDEDIVMITADHGCDPAYTATTDHTREYVPLLVLGKKVKPVNMGTRTSFADIAATVTELLGVEYETEGQSFAKEIL